MTRLIPINSKDDIFPKYRDTPIGKLLEYHDLGKPLDVIAAPQLLIGMCMDNRKHLTMPDNFAFIIRSGGANLRYSEFKVSYAIKANTNIQIVKLIRESGINHIDVVSPG